MEGCGDVGVHDSGAGVQQRHQAAQSTPHSVLMISYCFGTHEFRDNSHHPTLTKALQHKNGIRWAGIQWNTLKSVLVLRSATGKAVRDAVIVEFE